MTYIPANSKVVYQSKDGKKEKVFDALEWLVPPIGGILRSLPVRIISTVIRIILLRLVLRPKPRSSRSKKWP